MDHSQKIYYSHREVAETLQETPSTLRYWVDTFAVQVRRSSTGRLKYTQENLSELRLIRHLLRECNLTIDGAKATIRHNPLEAERRAEAITQLKAIRNELADLRQLIDQIDRYTSASEVRDRLRQEGLL